MLFRSGIPLLGLIGLFIASVAGIIISIYAGFSIFIIIDTDADIFEALKISFNLIKGHFWEMIVLMLSFILWYILGGVTLGIAMWWIMPYITVTFCNYYLHLYKHKYD